MKLDVFLTGIPRSGTTMMAGLMTSAENKTWCMSEPSSGGGKIGVVDCANRVFSKRVSKDDDLAAIATNVGVTKWGIKELDPKKRYGIIYKYAPTHVVVLRRNIIDCTISTIKFLGAGRFKTTESIANYMKMLSEEFLKFLEWIGDDVIVVDYDDLMNESTRDKLSSKINWPLVGDVNLYMVGRHVEEIREGVYNNRTDDERKQFSRMTKAAHRACAAYQKKFGYTD